ncbi:hypothetical protein [Bradyrhizobium sp. CCBAU 53421]|uniref:hypothetical protein n=1 Tax=Bradyrhizobium sp. CCBAU 53421 TaxID=1325120 RepID=UPI00188D38E3|nr:hypothetical protein [Bradyrhizobium sp. CCBAU 53421]QOZ37339.1 hypothetical protein XH92_42135 [Bradyrhizobium sp. CCBAU 53421]
MRYLSIVVLCAVATMSSGAALAQHSGTQAEQSACSRDAQRFCRKDLGNDGAVQNCLQTNRASLSRGCKKVFESHGM